MSLYCSYRRFCILYSVSVLLYLYVRANLFDYTPY